MSHGRFELVSGHVTRECLIMNAAYHSDLAQRTPMTASPEQVMSHITESCHVHYTHTYVTSGESPSKKGMYGIHTHTHKHTNTHTTHACKHAQVYTEWREPFEEGIQRIRQSWHTHTHTPIYRVERALTRGDAENGTAVPHAHTPTHTLWREPLKEGIQRIGQS